MRRTSFSIIASGLAVVVAGFIVLLQSSEITKARDAQTPDVTLVVDRSEQSVEVFVAAEAHWMEQAFGGVPSGLLTPQGHINFDDFRDGSAPLGDWMSRHWQFEVDGSAHQLEAMSFMLHPTVVALPVTTPLEGYIAMSICNAPLDQAPLPLALA